MRAFTFFFGLALLAIQAAAQAAPSLPPPMAQALAGAGIPATGVALVVQEAGAKQPSLELNARQAMNPASTIKLLTTFAALDLLGPAATWRTEARAVAPLEEGVLAGDLHLKGSGDPKLTLEQFWLLLRDLRARGVRDIRGDLVLDRTALQPGGHDPAAFDAQPTRPYNVGPDALLLNFKTVRLALVPDAARKAVAALPEPAPENLDIVNLIRLGNNGCGDWREALRADLSEHAGRYRLVLTGSYSAACGEKVWNVAVLPHDRYLLGVFGQLWRELGGKFEGSVRNAPVPANARLLAAIDSPALADIVRDINKFSNNVMARQLYLALGRNGNDGGGRPEDAEAALRRWLASRGLDFPELALENGSGLSRQERIAAGSMARLLAAAWQSPVMPELMSSLPVVAIDGTMKKRLNGNGIAGRAHIKTGYLEGVRAIAGYVLDRNGRRQIVVCFINHANAKTAQPALDALLAWVYEGEQ